MDNNNNGNKAKYPIMPTIMEKIDSLLSSSGLMERLENISRLNTVMTTIPHVYQRLFTLTMDYSIKYEFIDAAADFMVMSLRMYGLTPMLNRYDSTWPQLIRDEMHVSALWFCQLWNDKVLFGTPMWSAAIVTRQQQLFLPYFHLLRNIMSCSSALHKSETVLLQIISEPSPGTTSPSNYVTDYIASAPTYLQPLWEKQSIENFYNPMRQGLLRQIQSEMSRKGLNWNIEPFSINEWDSITTPKGLGSTIMVYDQNGSPLAYQVLQGSEPNYYNLAFAYAFNLCYPKYDINLQIVPGLGVDTTAPEVHINYNYGVSRVYNQYLWGTYSNYYLSQAALALATGMFNMVPTAPLAGTVVGSGGGPRPGDQITVSPYSPQPQNPSGPIAMGSFTSEISESVSIVDNSVKKVDKSIKNVLENSLKLSNLAFKTITDAKMLNEIKALTKQISNLAAAQQELKMTSVQVGIINNLLAALGQQQNDTK